MGETEVRLFSYGTLRQPEVQVALFGRELTGVPDRLPGHRLSTLAITDPEVTALSGSAEHLIATATGDPGDHIEGTVFAISQAELATADAYEVDDYTRALVPLASGVLAWVYTAGGAAARGDDRIARARTLYERAVFGGDAGVLAEAERDLDAVEADTALARGRIHHARFQTARGTGSSALEDPAELPLFERALELYRAVGDVRGEAEALFWIGCLHQFIRRDDETAVPLLERSDRLAARAGDRATRAEALRHLGIAAHAAGRLDEARERLEESSRLRRETGSLPGVAANLVGLAYIAAAQGRRADALAALDEADAIARANGAHAVARHVEQARAAI